MGWVMGRVRLALTIAFLLTPALPAPAAEPDPAAVDRLMGDALKAWDAPGAALVVVRDNRTVVLKGYGKRHASRPDPVTPDTVFPLASCTKAFTSTLIAMLADEGKLAWDDPVRDHLPGFRLSDPHADAMVTLRDLLAHRTGVGGNDLLWYRAPWGVDEVVRRIDRLSFEYPFRSGFQYSSIMYMAAGRAAARRAGKPWEELVRTRICDPLGMKGVTFTTKDIPPTAYRATGHRKAKDGKVEVMPAYEVAEPNPAGSVNATARDLGAWLKFHLAGGVVNGKRLISERNLNETKLPQNIIRLEGQTRAMNPDTHQLSYGMGWVVSDHRGKRVVAHGGMIDGFRVQITLLPDEKLGFAVLNNLHETRMNQAVTNTLIDLYCGLPPRDWNAFFLRILADDVAAKRAAIAARDKARKPGTKPTLPLAGYAGEYDSPAYGKAKVTAEGGKLVLEWSTFRCPLEHFQDDVFRITEGYLEDKLVEFAAAPGQGAAALRFIGVVFKR
jgi:CubicO group peptidase (beta-lactamase class C family)